MCTLFFASCCVISCWTWFVMKWSGFKLTTVSVFSPFFIFITVSLVPPSAKSIVLRYFLFSRCCCFFFFVAFSFFVLGFAFFSFLSLLLCLPHLRYFLGVVVFLFLRPFGWLFGFAVFVDFWLGFLPVCLCVCCVGDGFFLRG